MQKEKITRTEDQINNIKNFILNHGFSNMSDFAKSVNMERQNLFVDGKKKRQKHLI